MFDNLHLHFFLPQPLRDNEEALLNATALADWNGELDKLGRVRVEFRGLRIEYRPGQYWGRVRGSLHTFAQGSNVGVFTAAEVVQACADLAASLSLPQDVFVVRKLEAGVNLPVPTSPEAFLSTLVHHKDKPFWAVSPPSGVTRPLLFEALHTAYRLKYYDKGAYALRQGVPLPMGCRHLLRFEVVFTRARNLQKLVGHERVTLADLSTPAVLTAVAGYLHKHWNLTTRRVPLDYTDLPLNHCSLLRSGIDLEWWTLIRPFIPKSTYQRNKTLFRQLYKEVQERAGPHPYDLLLPRQLEALSPASPDEATRPKFDTVCHSCNQLDLDAQEEDATRRLLLKEKQGSRHKVAA